LNAAPDPSYPDDSFDDDAVQHVAEPAPAEPIIVAPKPEPVAAPVPPPAPQYSLEHSLGSSLIANGIVRRPSTSLSDPLAPIRRMSQAEEDRVVFVITRSILRTYPRRHCRRKDNDDILAAAIDAAGQKCGKANRAARLDTSFNSRNANSTAVFTSASEAMSPCGQQPAVDGRR